jgi:hypothetical protein
MSSRRAQFTEIQEADSRPSDVPAALLARSPRFVGMKGAATEQMRSLKVLVVGCGSVGGNFCDKLARHGIAQLWVLDPKSYKSASLATHSILPEEVGQSKAFAVGNRCKRISPATRVFACEGFLQDVPLPVMLAVNIVVLATDNLAVVAAAGQVCRNLGKPLFQAAVYGETLTAQVKVWGGSESGPCPACGFGPLEWLQLSQSMHWPCDGAGDAQQPPTLNTPTTMSTPHLCSTAADLCLNSLLRMVLKLGQPVADTVLDYCGYTNQLVTSLLVPNANCRCDHERWEMHELSQPLRALSLQQLQAAAGKSLESPLTFRIDGAKWVEKALCDCPQPHIPPGLVVNGDSLTCPKCAAPAQPMSFYSQEEFEPERLGAALTKPLGELGAAAPAYVLLRTGARTLLITGKPHNI